MLYLQSQGSADAVEEKTEFTVKLVKYAEDSKIKLIKEVKTLLEGMNLIQVGVCVCTVLHATQYIYIEGAQRVASLLG